MPQIIFSSARRLSFDADWERALPKWGSFLKMKSKTKTESKTKSKSKSKSKRKLKLKAKINTQ